MIENLKQVSNPRGLHRHQEIYLKPKSGTQHIKAQFLQTANGIDFSAVVDGASTGLPFLGAEWDIFVAPTYPAPEKTDIETTIYNLIAIGQETGEAPNFGQIADAVLALIRGEAQTPVRIHQPTQPAPLPDPEVDDIPTIHSLPEA